MKNVTIALILSFVHFCNGYKCYIHNPSRLVPLPTYGRSVKPRTVLQSIIDTHAEDVSSPKPPSKSESILYRFWHETKDYLLQFKNAGFRKTFREDIKYIFASAYNNIREGEMGKRGEELFAIQAVVVTFVILGVPAFVSFSIKAVGIIAVSGGLYFISRGVWDLRQNLTPFPHPIDGNQLVTTGIYGSVRHPLYTGLISLCMGVSIFSDSLDKAVLTVILAFFLDKKADREEELLINKHPYTYPMYAQTTKKLFPALY
jgi:protein-S-isoprenylcysteine O-methyltransferase Ste14